MLGRQKYIQQRPVVPDPSAFEVEMAIEKLKRHKLPGIDQIPAELLKARYRRTFSEFHKLVYSIWNKEWNESVFILIYKKGDKL